jgi:hypothetical protein|tara:strand:+ start:353 stop:658 length:306 start_codon:yes stop_codon:yes gene_type:complete
MRIYTFVIGSADDFESLDHLIDYVEMNKEKGFQNYSSFEFDCPKDCSEELVTMIGRGFAFSSNWSMDDTFSFLIEGELDPDVWDQNDNRVNEALRMRFPRR